MTIDTKLSIQDILRSARVTKGFKKAFWVVENGKAALAVWDEISSEDFDGQGKLIVYAYDTVEALVLAKAFHDCLVNICAVTTPDGFCAYAVSCSDLKMARFVEKYKAVWLITRADVEGCVEVRNGVHLQSSAHLQAEQQTWPEEDYAREFDFSSFSYWITTDDGLDPVGVSGADDNDLQELIETCIETDEATDEEGSMFLGVAMSLSWHRPLLDGVLLAGWMALAPLCAVLPYRPHILIEGSAGSGKTTIIHEFIEPLMWVRWVAQDNLTEAGLRKLLTSLGSAPVIIDNSEQWYDWQAVMSAIKLPPTCLTYEADGPRLRDIRTMFCLASKDGAISSQADRERLVVLSLGTPRSSLPVLSLSVLRANVDKLRNNVKAERLNKRSINLTTVTLENIDVFVEVATQMLGNPREGQKYGTLFAGAWSLVSRERVTEESATKFINQFGLTA